MHATSSNSGLQTWMTTAATNTPQLVGTPGHARLYGIQWENTGAKAYLHLFDAATAAAVQLGTTVPKKSIPLPAAGANHIEFPTIGLSFLKGIAIAVTGAPGADNTAPGVAALINIDRS